jgi:hypothetical protein
MAASIDIFGLGQQFNLLLIYDCPSKDREAYSKFGT